MRRPLPLVKVDWTSARRTMANCFKHVVKLGAKSNCSESKRASRANSIELTEIPSCAEFVKVRRSHQLRFGAIRFDSIAADSIGGFVRIWTSA